MSIPKTYKTEAIVLKHFNLGEADRILTLYTAKSGKVRAVAKGARKTKSRIGGHVEPLTHCSVMITAGRSLDILSQSQTIESFPQLRGNLWRTAQALYLIELTDAFTGEKMENYPIYKLLLETLHRLGNVHPPDLLFRFFEMQLVGHSGYQPQLHRCITCQTDIEPVDNFFSPSGGGMLCPGCSHTEPVITPVSVNTLKVLRLLQRGDWTTASRLKLKPQLSDELERVTHGYARYLLERELKSTGFLARLKRDFATDTPD